MHRCSSQPRQTSDTPTRDLAGLRGYVTNLAACPDGTPVTASRQRWIEAQTGWSIRKFVKTARRYRTIEIQAGRQTITAADPLPDELRQALDAIYRNK